MHLLFWIAHTSSCLRTHAPFRTAIQHSCGFSAFLSCKQRDICASTYCRLSTSSCRCLIQLFSLSSLLSFLTSLSVLVYPLVYITLFIVVSYLSYITEKTGNSCGTDYFIAHCAFLGAVARIAAVKCQQSNRHACVSLYYSSPRLLGASHAWCIQIRQKTAGIIATPLHMKVGHFREAGRANHEHRTSW